jgi:signal transduction histidine kinase
MPTIELNGRPLQVLLVEDSAEDAFLLDRHLRRNGFAPSVVRVETASEMLAELESGRVPDVVLADYNLPEFSGPAALALIRSLHLDIPFIMLSGAVTEETAVSSMRAGAQDYVSKQNLARLVPALERELNELASRRREQAAQRALQASESRFDRLVAAMPLGLLISDSAGRIVYANGSIETLLHYPPGTLRAGQTFLEGIFADSRALLTSLVSADGSARPNQLFETTCKIHGGGSLEALVGLTVLNPEREIAERQVAVFIADLTLQKKSEETLRRTEKLAVAGRLAAAIAHEINNPLAALTNCLYLLAQCSLSEEARSYLDTAQAELNRVSQITVQTLRFHRSSTRARTADLHELIDTVLALLQSRLSQQGIEVVKCYGQIPMLVIHEGEIRQFVANLLGNAIDALPRGGRITVRTAPVTHPKSGRLGVRLTIADNGVGMDRETSSRAFEPFFSTKGITGTGLGLWISREIVQKQDGILRMRSRKSTSAKRGGTVLTAFLPLDSPPTNQSGTAPSIEEVRSA